MPRLIELQDLDAVIATAENEGFRAAARSLGVEPSMVSRRVRNLEDRLGASLFVRTSAGTWLTVAGDLFLADVRRGLAQIERATQSVQEAGIGDNGTVLSATRN